MNLHQELRNLNQWARYYSQKGIDTPTTDIDVEIVRMNQKWNVFLLCYAEKDKSLNITMLLRTEGESVVEAATKAVEHFSSEMKSAPADAEQFKVWETKRLETVEARKKSGDIKEVKDSIFKEEKDMFRGLL